MITGRFYLGSIPMSVSFPDCFSDLLCDEDSGTILSEESPGCSSVVDSFPLSAPATVLEDGLLMTELVRGEKSFVPGIDYVSRLSGGPHPNQSVSASAREESVAWILKVHASYRFQPLTAYLSVNYMDRFLYSRCLPVTFESDGWPMQLLSVSCLSLAAKMEEPLVPSLLDLQTVQGAKYVFQPRTIRRMELLVLTVLDWRLRSITPFSFLGFCAFKVDPTGTFAGFLVSRSTEVIMSNIQGFLKYRPSCIAAAAMLHAASTVPRLSLRNPGDAESWCGGLIKEEMMSCYRFMEASLLENNRRKASKVLPQFRVTTRAWTRYGGESSPSSSSSSSSSSDPHNKRRRLNVSSWIGNGKGISEPDHEEKE